jgi:hypothetical protein
MLGIFSSFSAEFDYAQLINLAIAQGTVVEKLE